MIALKALEEEGCRLLTGLGVDEKTVKDACQMEHAVSRESHEALKSLAVEKNGGNL